MSSQLDGLARIPALVKAALDELQPRPITYRRTVLDETSEVRAGVVNKLVEALSETEKLAKSASGRPRKGAGGIPGKARWYHLMTVIAQTLDQVLRSVSIDEIQEKMTEMEKTIDELQRTTPKTG